MYDLLNKDWYTQTKRVLSTEQRASCFQCDEKDFSPQTIYELRNTVTDKKVSCNDLLIDSSIWKFFVGDDRWHSVLDPEHRKDNLERGHLGVIFGVDIWTDAYLHPEKKFMQSGEVLAVGTDKKTFSYLKINFDFKTNLKPYFTCMCASNL
jgi:hypothetical protein